MATETVRRAQTHSSAAEPGKPERVPKRTPSQAPTSRWPVRLLPRESASLVHGSLGALMRVEEEQLLVCSKCPQIGRNDLFCLVAHGAHRLHSLEPEDTCELCFGELVLGPVHPFEPVRDGGGCSLELLHHLSGKLGVLHRRNDVLVNHVDHCKRLHLHGARIVIVHDDRARLRFLLAEHFHLLKEGDVLGRGERRHGLDAGIDARHAALARLDGPLLRIAVAIEDHLPVGVESLGRDVDGLGTLLDGVSKHAEGFGEDGAQHGVDHRHVL
mmetsp:Transcript_21562/g.49539  ORF Transcript_21562/g.49539 Transcript_21562/m.49539 type:complete len:271 (-) Transcript_21562:205-1017(-)